MDKDNIGKGAIVFIFDENPYLSRNDFISCCRQRILYLVDMFLVTGFHFQAEVTTVNICGVAYPFMVDRYYICACAGNDLGNVLQLSGFIDQFDGHGVRTTGFL